MAKVENGKLQFGKYNGFSLEHVADHDPSYILWMNRENVIDIPEAILTLCKNKPPSNKALEEDLDDLKY